MSQTLVIVHAGIASATKAPEFLIDKEEGDLLANATANLLAQFDLKPDPRVQAIIGFVTACGTVYAPRVYMVRARKVQEQAERAAGTGGVGTGGVYGPQGEAMGTTDFRAN